MRTYTIDEMVQLLDKAQSDIGHMVEFRLLSDATRERLRVLDDLIAYVMGRKDMSVSDAPCLVEDFMRYGCYFAEEGGE